MEAAIVKQVTQRFACTSIPAGMEIISSPEKVAILLPVNRSLCVAEGSTVSAGEPLCSNPGIGMFAPVSGVVKKIMVQIDNHLQKHRVVEIISSGSATYQTLFTPDNDILARSCETLLMQSRMCGSLFPDECGDLLVMMVDEDVGLTANRWCFEKEMDRLIIGVQVLKKMFMTSTFTIVVPKGVDATKKRAFAKFGRIIEVPCAYPDVNAELLLRRDAVLKKVSKVTIVDSQQVVSLAGSLLSGYPQITQLVSLRIGRKSVPRLFQVPVGIAVDTFLRTVNCQVQDGMQIVIGGEFTGRSCSDLSRPLLPRDGAVLIVPPDQVAKSENSACVRCGRCTNVCPVSLRVETLGKCTELQRFDEALRLGINNCIDCGLCTAVCSTHRPLAHLLATAKQHIELQGVQ